MTSRAGEIGPMPRRRRALPILAWVLLTAATTALALRDYQSFQIGTWEDDAKYILLAQSLVRGDSYGLHVGPVPVLTGYPFGFPLALAPIVAAFPERLDAAQTVSLAATLMNVALLFWGWTALSGDRTRTWGLVAAALYALSPHVVSMAHMVMSEPLFTTFVLAALIASETAARQVRPRARTHVLLGLTTACAFYTRSAGIALVVAVLLRLAFRRGRHLLPPLTAAGAGALLLVVPVVALTPLEIGNLVPSLYLSRLPGASGASDQDDGLAARIASNLWSYSSQHVRRSVVSFGGGEGEQRVLEALDVPLPDLAINLGLALFVAAGFVWSVAGPLQPTVVLFEVLYGLIVLTWRYDSHRLLYCLIPFLSLQLLWGARLGVALLVRALPAPSARRLPQMAAAALALAILFGDLRNLLAGGETSLRYCRDLRLGTTWLRQNAAPGDVVLAQEPVQVHLYSQHPVARATAVVSEADVDRLGVRWVLIAPRLEWDPGGRRRYDEHTTQVLDPLVDVLVQRGRASLVYRSDEAEMVRLYRIDP